MNSFDPHMSIYIPRCDTRSLPKRDRNETDKSYESHVSHFISSKFNLYYGNVTRIDLLGKLTADNYTYYIAFVHLNWYNTHKAHLLQASILDPDVQAKIHYNNDKWFWHIKENTKQLTAEEAALHKRIFYLQRDLAKVERERNAAHVLLLQKAAPNNWTALYNYVANSNPRDYHAALCSHVRDFIPMDYHAQLMLEPLSSEPARVEPARVEPARVEPARVEPARVEPARVEPARHCGFDDDFPKLLREKPQRAKAISKRVTFEEWELPKFELPKFELPKFELPSEYENDGNAKTGPLCVGSQSPITGIAPIEEETLTVMFNPSVPFGRAIRVEPKKAKSGCFEECKLPKEYENNGNAKTGPLCVGSQSPITDFAPIEEETLTLRFNPSVPFGRAIRVEPKKANNRLP